MSEETSLIIFFELVKDQFRFRKPKVRQKKMKSKFTYTVGKLQNIKDKVKIVNESLKKKKVITFMKGTIQPATNFCTKKMY